MALSPLATVADMEARGVTISPAETAVANTFLATASATVREAAKASISRATSTITLPGTANQYLPLPSQPVAAVSGVKLDGEAVSDWQLSYGALWRSCGWRRCEPSEVEVTYTHGLPEVPADIVDLVCRLAARALVAFREDPAAGGLADRTPMQERIGDWSATYGYREYFSETELPEYKRAQLAARFGSGAMAVRFR
ncbi:hypothetical protein ACQEU8_02500 [Streptomyces sp. CA-250714]|uniref:hypothetical protein n=1 Tax=Streptomyces sp. CA-250714 TaxID=3240060 RepID=UPI003D8CCA2E